MNVGEKISIYCKKNGISVATFAKLCGLSEMVIYNWKNGKVEPSVRCLRKIEAATGVPVHKWLEEKAA